ncbi:MAG: hypothetical protein KKF56_00980 [Nanoarchaeota archaeon]|nr:hypothetical protein [Nanoarchaeota archaeon]
MAQKISKEGLSDKELYRLIFLRMFTKEIIMNAYKKPKIPNFMEAKDIQQEFAHRYTVPTLTSAPVPLYYHNPQPRLVQQRNLQTNPFAISHPEMVIINQPQQRIRQMPMQIQPIPTLQSQETPMVTPMPMGFNLGKIQNLISDRNVDIIECKGPDQFIIVQINARMNVTNIRMTKQDIQNVVNAFSQVTRIPLTHGVFKAAVGNLIITAIISETVGTSFVITKLSHKGLLYPGHSFG